jgi:7-carboxy-7-deazaguanine synthase
MEEHNQVQTSTLVVNEIYLSLQGESSLAGWPCIFVRLTGCNLRCSYCDSAYSFTEGRRLTISEVLDRIQSLAASYGISGPRLPMVELTGGEPLLQPGTVALMRALCELGYTVLLETSGAWDISPVDPRVRRIVDLKCPSSGEQDRNRWDNLAFLTDRDEVKFVIATRTDYEWAREVLQRYRLSERCTVLFSWASPLTAAQHVSSLRPGPGQSERWSQRELAERMVADALPVRFQVQMHKVIWPADQRGV